VAAKKKAENGNGDNAVPFHSEETRQQVINLYQEGHRLADITRETGVPRATIYWILKREGIRTDRVARSGDEMLSMGDVLEALRRSEQEVGRLTAELERERSVNRWFMERVTMPDDISTELTAPAKPARPRRNPVK
jgi:transposase-like protein